jgi:hypothetical protein
METDILNDILTLTVDFVLLGRDGYSEIQKQQPSQNPRYPQGSKGSNADRQSIGSLVSRGDSVLSRDSRDTKDSMDRRPDSRA